MNRPGDVVLVDFSGATGTKRRPAVVVSSDTYRTYRPDLVVGLVTSQIVSANAPTDYILQDWAEAGLKAPSAFRAYFGMVLAGKAETIGHLSDRDWEAVRARLAAALAVP